MNGFGAELSGKKVAKGFGYRPGGPSAASQGVTYALRMSKGSTMPDLGGAPKPPSSSFAHDVMVGTSGGTTAEKARMKRRMPRN